MIRPYVIIPSRISVNPFSSIDTLPPYFLRLWNCLNIVQINFDHFPIYMLCFPAVFPAATAYSLLRRRQFRRRNIQRNDAVFPDFAHFIDEEIVTIMKQ